jgi:ribonuclease D
VNILIARSKSDIEAAYEKLVKAEVLGCDTETSGLSARHGRLFSVQFSDGDFNVLVPTSENIQLGKLELVLSNPNITKIFHNAKFDLEFLRENGFVSRKRFLHDDRRKSSDQRRESIGEFGGNFISLFRR